MTARKNPFVIVAACLALPMACGDGDGRDTVIVDCAAGAGGESAGGMPGSAGDSASDGGTGGSTDGGAGAGEGGAVAGGSGAGGQGGVAGVGTRLQVTIENKPDESTVLVDVMGPAGFAQTISSTTTFQDLAPGAYTVVARPARVDGAIVDELYGATVSDASPTLEEDQAVTVSVAYSAAKLAGSGMLWTSNSGNHSLLGYSAEQLAETGAVSAEPSVILTLPDLGSADAFPGPIAFDPFTGNLWVGYCGTGVPAPIAAFQPTSLASSGEVTAAVELGGPNDVLNACVTALTFDASGDLWVGFYANWFVRYSRASIAQSGTPAPEVEFFQAAISGLQDLAFDQTGNLFASAYDGNIVQKYLPATLAQSSASIPAVVDLFGTNVLGPTGMAFDHGGNLWVATYDDSTLRGYDPFAQSTSGDPTSAAEITSADVAGPQFIAFDEADNLWLSGYDTSQLVRIDAADLDSVAPVSAAAVYTSTSMDGNYSVRLNPPANGN